MNRGLTGRTVVVSGSAQGIGKAVALACASHGMRVIGLDIDAEAGQGTRAQIIDRGAKGFFYRCNLADLDDLTEVTNRIGDEFEQVDVLVNNAARVIHSHPEDITADQWNQVISVSLTGAAFLAQRMGRLMIDSEHGGAIVNLASIAGLAALGRGNFAYSVAKAGIIGMTRELAVEWAPFGIRVNAVAPSQIATEGFSKLVGNPQVADGKVLSTSLRGVPMGRLGEPSEVADAILFLASDSASFITGVTLPVDGGSLALHAGGSVRGVRVGAAE